MLRNFDAAWEFMDKEWGYETNRRPDTETKPVQYKKCVLHDFLESEGKTLLLGADGNYYTAEDKSGPYGDYAWTEWTEYGRFVDPRKVEQHLAT